jgi:HEAT repeat protein
MDSDERVRGCASAVLSYMPDANDIPLLLGPILMAEADVALKMLGQSAVKPLLDAIKQRAVARRDRAIQALYDIDPVAAADPVLEVGKHDTDKQIRYEALLAALSHGDKRAIEPLLAIVKADLDKASKPDESDRHGSSFARWADGLQAILATGDKRGADLFLSAIDAGKLTVWDIQGNGPRDPRLVPHLIKALADKTDPCLPYHSLGLLQDYDDDPRARAALSARGWEKHKEKSLTGESLESLLDKLRGPDEGLIKDAARELGRRREKRAVKPLWDLVWTGHFFVPHTALTALGEIGDASVVPALIKYLDSASWNHDTNCDPRRHAIAALGRLRAKEAVEPLVIIASDPDSYGPYEALEALGAIGDQRALEALDKVFRTSADVSLRRRAWQVLHKSRNGASPKADDS